MKSYNKKELDTLEKAIAEIDHLLNDEAVIFSRDEEIRLYTLADHLIRLALEDKKYKEFMSKLK